MHISKEIAHYFAAVLFLFRQKLPSRLLPNIFRRLDSSFIAFFFSATASFTSTVSNIWPPATGTSLPISFWISFRYGTSSTSQKEKAIPLRPARPVRHADGHSALCFHEWLPHRSRICSGHGQPCRLRASYE